MRIAPRLAPLRPRVLELALFGGPVLEADQVRLALSPYQGALLGLLSVHGQRGMRQGEILSLLWSEGTDAQLRRRLSQLVYSIHLRVGERLVHVQGGSYFLRSVRLTTDLTEFLSALGARSPARAVELATRGFLSGLASPPTWEMESWIDQRDLRFRSDARTLASESWSEGEQRGDWKMAQEAAEGWLRLDPLDEHVLRKLLHAIAMRGRVQEAEAVYAAFHREALSDDPSWKPEDPTERLLARLGELSVKAGGRSPLGVSSVAVDPPLVGRTLEVDRLLRLIRDPEEGRLSTILITGESGIGKTRLAREVLARVPFDGIRVLEGTCSDFEHAIPLSPLARALAPDWVTSSVEGLGQPWESLLRPLLPDFAGTSTRSDPRTFAGRPEDVPAATREAFLRLFGELASSDPVVLFLDDFHWIDRTSLTVLEHVRASWRGPGIVLVAALRVGELEPGSPVEEWLRSVDGTESVVDLRPLSREETRELITHAVRLPGGGAPLDVRADQLDTLAEVVDGHPLLALESIRGWRGAAAPGERGEAREGIPDLIRSIAARRYDQLGAASRHTLTVLSVSEKPVGLSVLEGASEAEPGTLTEALDDLAERHFVQVSPRGIGFRHGLVREGVYGSLSSGTRVATHRKVAEALIDLVDPGLFPDVALHLFAAAEPQRAMPYVLEAARAATSSGGWAEAKSLLELALESSPTGATRAELSALLARVLFLSGEFLRAEALWQNAEEAFRAVGREDDALFAQLRRLETSRLQPGAHREDLLDEVRKLRAEAGDRGLERLVAECMSAEVRILDSLGQVEEVRTLTRTAGDRARAEDLDTRLQFLFVAMLGAVYGEPDEAAQVADEAARLAKEHGRDDLLLKALNWKIIAYYHQARLSRPEGREVILSARRLASSSSDPDQRFWLEGNVGAWQVEVADYEGAARSFNRAERALGSLLAPHLRRNLFLNRGQLLLECGRYEEAEAAFTLCMNVGRISTNEWQRGVAWSGIGLSLLRRSRIAEAQAIRERLPPKPPLWTFDPFMWIAFEARLDYMSADAEAVLDRLVLYERDLKMSVPTAWLRLRLLRFELSKRKEIDISQEEISETVRFLETREMTHRTSELRRIIGAGAGPGA